MQYLSYVPFLSVSTAELVANLRPSTLSQKYFDDTSVVVVVGDHHFVYKTRLNTSLEPRQSHIAQTQMNNRHTYTRTHSNTQTNHSNMHHLISRINIVLLHQLCTNQSSSPSSSPFSLSVTTSLFHSRQKNIFSINLSSTNSHTCQLDWLHRLVASLDFHTLNSSCFSFPFHRC